MSNREERITKTIQNAIVNNENRVEQLDEVASVLNCSRQRAKELYFGFIYNTNESYLEFTLERGDINDY